MFELVPFTSPGFIIVGGVKGNEGVVIARDVNGVNFTHWLSDEEWFVLETNKDVYSGAQTDERYNNAVDFMNELG